MTQQKDLKRRIRERMAKTGESYTAARANVLAERPDISESYDTTRVPPHGKIAVVEPRDITEEAVALGLKCKVLATDGFDARRALRQLHDVLVKTSDAELEVMRAALLWGRPPARRRPWFIEDLRNFLVRAKAGIGGIAPNGWIVAFVCDGVMLLGALSMMRGGAITLWLRRVEQTGADELALAGITLR